MFDKVFYINLDRRPDRNENVQNLVKKIGLENKTVRITAVDGSKLDVDAISKDIITDRGIKDAKNNKQRVYVPLTPGGIGCAMSHRNVWQKIVDDDIQTSLILEDDIRIDKKFHSKLQSYQAHWPKTYDVIFLGYHPTTFKYIYKQHVNDIFVRSDKFFGLFGYIVSRSGAEKLLKTFPIDEQIDTEMHKKASELNIDIYLVKPKHRIIFSDPSEYSKKFGTDIQIREESFISFGNSGNNEDIFEFFSNILFLILIITLIVIFVDFISKKQ